MRVLHRCLWGSGGLWCVDICGVMEIASRVDILHLACHRTLKVLCVLTRELGGKPPLPYKCYPKTYISSGRHSSPSPPPILPHLPPSLTAAPGTQSHPLPPARTAHHRALSLSMLGLQRTLTQARLTQAWFPSAQAEGALSLSSPVTLPPVMISRAIASVEYLPRSFGPKARDHHVDSPCSRFRRDVKIPGRPPGW